MFFTITGGFVNATLNIVKDDKNFVSRKGNSDAAFGKISKISKCFQRSKQKRKK